MIPSAFISVHLRFLPTIAACLTLVLAASVTYAQEGADPAPAAGSAGETFAGAFFVSRVVGPDGQRHIDVFGTMLLWILLLLSVLSIGMIGSMALTNQRKAFVPAGVKGELRKVLAAGRLREAIDLTAAEQSHLSRIINPALRDLAQGSASAMRALEQAADEQATQRLRRIEYLNILAQVSPMIGLFGTVWGMILAFRSIVLAGGSADPVQLAGGIGTALTTTFWGLIIAIPALAAYAIIRNKIDQFATEAERTAEDLLNEYKPKPAPKAAQPAAV